VTTALIPVDFPRRFQPQDSFDLAPEIRGYASSVLLGSAFGQTTDGRPITYGGGLVPGATTQGWAYVGDGSDNIAYATPSRPFVFGTDKDFTAIAVFRKNTAGTNGSGIAGWGATGGSTGNTQFALFGSSTNANAARMVAVDASGDVFLNTDATAFGIDDTNWHVLIVKGRVAHASSDSGRAVYFADGKQLNTVSGLSDTTPDATTFNVVNACAVRRGGSSIVAGPYSVALFIPLHGIQMPDEWCRRASHLESVWATCFRPRRIWVPVSTASAGTHTTEGALASDAATIAGTAAHLTLHATSGALASDAAVIAGTATHLTLHTTEGALASEAATIAGDAEYTADGATHATTGALASADAAIAGTAAHLTLHTTSGALAADAATVAGTAAHLTLHATSGALQAESATMAGTAVHSGAGAVVDVPPTGGGWAWAAPKKKRHDYLSPPTREQMAERVRKQREALGILPKPAQKRIEAAAKKEARRASPDIAELAPVAAEVAQDTGASLQAVIDAIAAVFQHQRGLVAARMEADAAQRQEAEAQAAEQERMRMEAAHKAWRERLPSLLKADAEILKQGESERQEAIKTIRGVQKALLALLDR
jgi:hypothetical protein